MRTTLIRIGNSWGVRLPKAVIEQTRLGPDLELEVVNGAVVIRNARTVREGWSAAAAACHAAGDDQLGGWA